MRYWSVPENIRGVICLWGNDMHVLAGTSGTGKTALLKALVERGYEGYTEPVRKTLEHQLETDGPALPSKDAGLFVKELLAQSLADYSHAMSRSKVSFFDRGLPDLIAYAHRFNVDSKAVEIASQRYRYSENVFVLPPWEDIFEQDEFRKATYSEYENFHGHITQAYTDMGYCLVEVPKVSILSRVDFIESILNEDRHITCS
jgi:predicted ATPase